MKCPTLIRDALHMLSASETVPADYARGLAVGVMATLQAYHSGDWNRALADFTLNAPADIDINRLPEPWRQPVQKYMEDHPINGSTSAQKHQPQV